MNGVGFEIAQWVIRVALAVPIAAMGINHFRRGPARVMSKMIPPRITGGDERRALFLVRLTGLCEIAGGIGLLIPYVQYAAAAALIVFLVAVFPANAYAAEHPDRFRKLAFPYWPRFAGQLVVIGLLGITLAS
jgi:uncharacterized membrane protein